MSVEYATIWIDEYPTSICSSILEKANILCSVFPLHSSITSVSLDWNFLLNTFNRDFGISIGVVLVELLNTELIVVCVALYSRGLLLMIFGKSGNVVGCFLAAVTHLILKLSSEARRLRRAVAVITSDSAVRFRINFEPK